MRIAYAYDVELPNRFAATIQILRTGRALADLGHGMRLVCDRISDRASVLADLGIPPHPGLALDPAFDGAPRWKALRPHALRRRLARSLAADPADVVMSRGETGLALVSGVWTPADGAATVFEMHKLLYLDRAERRAGGHVDVHVAGGRLRAAEARAYHRADGVLFLTDALRQAAELAFGTRSGPTAIVPSGTSLPARARPVETDVDLVFAGKIERRKGVFLMVEAMHHLPGRRLRLIGTGADLKAARARVSAEGLGDRIECAGPVPHVRVAKELARGRVGLCPLPSDVDHVSTAFTSPMKLLEMMALGMAIVATDLPSVRAVCRDEVEALLVPADASSMAGAAERLLRNPDLAARLGQAARRRAAEFGWSRRAERIAAFCSTLRG